MKAAVVVSIALLIFSSLYSAQGVAMSLFSGEDVYVFSAMDGHLTYQGQPAAGAKIIRHVAWKDREGESEETVADENGYFSFPSMKRKLRQFLPAQFVAHQSIFVVYRDERVQIWGTGKLGKEEYAEVGRKPLEFTCELTDDPRRVDVEYGFIFTSCKWK
ncbi:DUF6795 domain-containing protein [Marinimicrobium alkaliphilum]|uniref:DUF6795 domain-containing protein n=1 Tax=Marinimicrobium alkaliphilum TaxID=2202654 RepID=UPI000DB9F559|nr:DUF6795 domain-containing protein [Marinimicrobium alkaliphilum]